MKRHRPQAKDFTVGWISALPVEYTAAKAMLDEEYESERHMVQYTLGRLHNHNIVMACLPAGQIGTNAAATAAAEMRLKFSALRFSLLVGIGGGVPSKDADIRLGDVVISQPQGIYGGVVQYDLGKMIAGGVLVPTGTMNVPPRELLTAVSILRSNQSAAKSKVSRYLSGLSQIAGFNRCNAGPDNLFDPLYNHAGETCDQCDRAKIIPRAARSDHEPRIHFGTIASGNQVIKDGATRDRLSAEFGGILCFEMEAAGLMNQVSCLVIRGICDYSDSHKNKKWQPFAAAAAAACAKEILSFVPSDPHGIDPRDCQHEILLGDPAQVNQPKSAEDRLAYMNSLRFEQMHSRQATIKNAHIKTCRWLTRRSEYQDWLNLDKFLDHHGFLWIKGKPGTGKSTIMKFAYTQAVKNMRDRIIISFFFNARGEEMEKSVLGMYRSLLWQLLQKIPHLQTIFDAIQPIHPINIDSYQWTIENTQNLWRDAIESLGERSLMCFIDALDECEEDQIRDMISFFNQLEEVAFQSGCKLNICLSSRHYPHISMAACIELVLENQENHEQDIASYIHTELRIGNSQLAEDIKNEVLERASRIFLWAVLVVQMLNKLHDSGRIHRIRQELDKIPNGLHELLEDILTRDRRNMDEMLLCLQWVLYAKRPLNCEELYFAILSKVDSQLESVTGSNVDVTRDLMKRFILDTSKGLAEETKSKKPTIQFIHESVRDFLLKENVLDRLGANSRSTFPAVSHDSLKQCCLTYMRLGVSLNLPEHLPKASTEEAKSLRQQIITRFPLLEYAVQHILYHSNASERYGISQKYFLEAFPLDIWITLNNLFEIYEIRRYTPNASQLYIFADKNLVNLIDVKTQHISDINVESERYRYPLLAAIAHRHEDAIKALLRPVTNLDSETAVWNENKLFPTSEEYQNAVDHMLNLGERTVSGKKFSLIFYAIEHIMPGILKVIFVARTTDAGSRVKLLGAMLCLEVRSGNEHEVQLLLENGADVEYKEYKQRTPLSLAAEKGYTETVKLLLQHNVNIESRDFHQQTALSLAAERGHTETVKLLLQHNADTESKDSNQQTLLSWAAERGHTETVKLLLQHNADTESKDCNQQTPLSWAARSGHTEIVKLLLQYNANIEFKDCNQQTALSLAARNGHIETVKLLLQHNADTESKGSNTTNTLFLESIL